MNQSALLHEFFGKEYEFYIKKYLELQEKGHPIVIKVGGEVIKNELDTLTRTLAIMSQAGLYPIVVHGGGPQLNEALEKSGEKTVRIDGLRFTSEKARSIVQTTLKEINQSIVKSLRNQAVEVTGITNDVLIAKPLDLEKYGWVGKVQKINLEPVTQAFTKKHVTVVACSGQDNNGTPLNINGDTATEAIAQAVNSQSVLAVTDVEAVYDENGERMHTINLDPDELSSLLEQPWLHGGMELKVKTCARLARVLEHGTVTIVSASGMLKELFTHEGSGTIFREGEYIRVYDDLSAVNKNKLQHTIEDGLEGKLADDYWQSLQNSKYRIYVTDRSHHALAIVKYIDGFTYVDKIAISKPFADDDKRIWRKIVTDHPEGVIFRTKPKNQYNNWLFKEGANEEHRDGWVVWWYGIEDTETINAGIELALSQPVTLIR
jgi:acetylglutamate kinase